MCVGGRGCRSVRKCLRTTSMSWAAWRFRDRVRAASKETAALCSHNICFSRGGKRDELPSRGSKSLYYLLIFAAILRKREGGFKRSLINQSVNLRFLWNYAFGISTYSFLYFIYSFFSLVRAFYLSSCVPHLRCNCHHGSKSFFSCLITENILGV